MLKLVLWCTTVIALIPTVWLIAASAMVLSFANDGAPPIAARGAKPGLDAQIHDSYVGVGGLTTAIHPRAWALVAMSVGVLLIVGGMFTLLHVPARGDAR